MCQANLSPEQQKVYDFHKEALLAWIIASESGYVTYDEFLRRYTQGTITDRIPNEGMCPNCKCIEGHIEGCVYK